MPLACTLVPGACPAMSTLAAVEPTTTGLGSCGSGEPCGASRQMRQARMRARYASSSAAAGCRATTGQALALGRDDTASYQRRTLESSCGSSMRAGFMKSMPIIPVMSAIE